MAYGPHAVAHLEGKVVFVRGAAPDEEVEAVVREERRSFAYADTVAVVRASAARRPTPCVYLPRCGGCPWQHIDYERQLEAKRAVVRELLKRIARLDCEVAPPLSAPVELGYRRRLKLRVEDGRVGFYAAASHELVEIERCLLAEPTVDAAIPLAAELARSLATRLRRLEITATDVDIDRVVLTSEAEGSWVAADDAVCRRWLESNRGVAGLAIGGRGWRREWGDLDVVAAPEPELSAKVPAGSFTQVNPAANRLLVDTVVRLADVAAGSRVLDLFAGSGNLSFPLARRGAAVAAVEQDARAVAAAREAAHALGLATFAITRGRAEREAAARADCGERFDVALLDPPRSGAAGVLEPLLRLAPARIVYVACDPATLARDLATLGRDYRVDFVQPIDMFPQTYHVETVVRAEHRTCAPRTRS
jgi:23S rRNA (uracil1939-C5)-methyltransferase